MLETEAARWICTCLTMKKSDGHEMAHILSSFVGKRPVPEVTNRWVGKRGEGWHRSGKNVRCYSDGGSKMSNRKVLLAIMAKKDPFWHKE